MSGLRVLAPVRAAARCSTAAAERERGGEGESLSAQKLLAEVLATIQDGSSNDVNVASDCGGGGGCGGSNKSTRQQKRSLRAVVILEIAQKWHGKMGREGKCELCGTSEAECSGGITGNDTDDH